MIREKALAWRAGDAKKSFVESAGWSLTASTLREEE
jgi:hypothetical protein